MVVAPIYNSRNSKSQIDDKGVKPVFKVSTIVEIQKVK